MNEQSAKKEILSVHTSLGFHGTKWVDPEANILQNENSIFQNEKGTKIYLGFTGYG